MLTGLLDNYYSAFERLVAVDEKIGLTGNNNLLASLNMKSREIETLFLTLVNEAAVLQQFLIKRLEPVLYRLPGIDYRAFPGGRFCHFKTCCFPS